MKLTEYQSFKLVLMAVVIFGIFLFLNQLKSCTGGSGSTKDTISVVHDTVWRELRDTIVYKPVEVKTIYKPGLTVVLHDTLETIETILQKVDSAKILAQYLAKRYYTKTSKVQYGTVTIKDTVTQNRIIGRGIELKQNIPEVIKTITVEAEKRVTGYIGIMGLFNKDNIPYASGPTFDLEFKNGAMIGTGFLITKDDPMVLLSIKSPIRLKRLFKKR